MLNIKVGDRVRIRRDSQFADQSAAVGTVLELVRNGWVRVEFDDGCENNYRYGDPEEDGGVCDLEPISTAVGPGRRRGVRKENA